MNDQTPSQLFTICICTRNRADLVDICLQSLVMHGLKYPVMIIDNGSEDHTKSICEKFQNKLQLTYIFEKKPGLSVARNCAIKHCKTEYIVYLDDDARITESWITAIIDGIEKWKPDIFGGPYIPYYLTEKPDWFPDILGSHHTNIHEQVLGKKGRVSGGNMGWKMTLFDEIGVFSENLGMTGNAIGVGEETELQARSQELQPPAKIVFLPKMLMEHYVPEEKMNLKYWIKRRWIHGSQLKEIDESYHQWWKLLPMTGLEIYRLAKVIMIGLLRDRKMYPKFKGYFAHKIVPRLGHWSYLYHLVFPSKK